MSGAKPEMQKAADTTDMSVLFFQMVLIFGKATHKTIQALRTGASRGRSHITYYAGGGRGGKPKADNY